VQKETPRFSLSGGLRERERERETEREKRRHVVLKCAISKKLEGVRVIEWVFKKEVCVVLADT
jgi:hypothetical protein